MEGKIICFTSDFGLDDTWVGVCHGIIYETCPEARVVDLSHLVPAFDIMKGAVIVASGVWQMPSAIHLGVVDPGVGGVRADLCLVTGGGTMMVGPDNGLLVPATWRSGGIAEAYAIDASRLGPRVPLPTFHGRDVMAPAAAALACGRKPSELGEKVDPGSLAAAPFAPCRHEGHFLIGEVLDVDRFGSVRIGMSAKDLAAFVEPGENIELSLGHLKVSTPLASSFSDVAVGATVALIDSSGWLTLAIRGGAASERYSIEPGNTVRVETA